MNLETNNHFEVSTQTMGHCPEAVKHRQPEKSDEFLLNLDIFVTCTVESNKKGAVCVLPRAAMFEHLRENTD